MSKISPLRAMVQNPFAETFIEQLLVVESGGRRTTSSEECLYGKLDLT